MDHFLSKTITRAIACLKKAMALCFCVSLFFITSSCSDTQKGSCIKVLLDTDMVEGFDDGVAMMMLLGSENIDLLGVTTENGNDFASEGVAFGIRQMEICGVDNVPIIQGCATPVREGRYETTKDEVERSLGMPMPWIRDFSVPTQQSWKEFYISTYGNEPRLSPAETDPVDFIIRSIKANPNEITLIAIGPTNNIAKALIKSPEIASLAKEIIYMGGAFYCEGNTTKDAELNVLIDPEAEKICFNAPWKKQTIVSLDVCNTVQMNKSHYDNLISGIKNELLKKIFTEGYIDKMFQNDPDAQSQVWDVISAALAIDPTLLLESNTESVDVNVNPDDIQYGKTLVDNDNKDLQKAIIPLKIDNDRFWVLVSEALSRL